MKADLERLGVFYLGRRYDPAAGRVTDEPVLYDSRDLTTHAVCVGMTGSGKTGLCLALLEEAALDGIPAIAVDPKGDLGNLALAFPELRAEDFRPWVEEAEAARRGRTADEHAAAEAALWRKGLAEWGEDGARIARFRQAAEVAIYTPGSTAGLPLSILRSFAAPPPALAADGDAFRERIVASVSGLLALLGIEADPIRGREHILLSTLLDRAWREGRDVDLAGLVREVQRPPFDRIGVLDLESFYPARDRGGLVLALNALLASPGFAAWREGEPLEVPRLLWTAEGKPRISVLSIAHLSDPERMFFVTLLLNEVLAWVRTQPGTGSLRAILYVDEVFGYLPPVANPPSKTPLLTLLKQARAFGLGVVLATQNPVDLDYKGLSNAGTWLLGRLQTERDAARVLDGLAGAAAAAAGTFDRGETERTLAGLRSRVFLLHDVHEEEPVLFQSRWALSYLRGPLTRAQIERLMAPRKAVAPGAAPPAPLPAPTVPAGAAPQSGRPALPPGVAELFLARRAPLAPEELLVYRPALAGEARLHFTDAKATLDRWEEMVLAAPLEGRGEAEPWDAPAAAELAAALGLGSGARAPGLDLVPEPEARASYAPLPAEAGRETAWRRWGSALGDHLYRTRTMRLWRCPALKETSAPGVGEREFRAALALRAREGRDLQVEKLRARYAQKVASLQQRVRAAEERVARERSQYDQQKVQTAISFGATILGGLFGRRTIGAGSVGRATTAARGVGRAARARQDVARAEGSVETLRRELDELEAEVQSEVARVEAAGSPDTLELESVEVRPRKADIAVRRVALLWLPWRLRPDGSAEPAFLRAI